MLSAAAGQALILLALAVAVPRLARAVWPLRAPALALLLWQALALAAGLLLLEVTGTVALAPLGTSPGSALATLPAPLPWWAALAAGAFAVCLVRLLVGLAAGVLRTVAARHRHRVLVDLVATRNPLLHGASVVDVAVPVAYCLPGLRPRVVVSRGVLSALCEPELRAVLEHERAHVAARHDLVVLPFAALGTSFPWLPPVRVAREQVALLVELLADAAAARRHGGVTPARALVKVGAAQAPVGALGVGGSPGAASPVVLRADRLLDPPPPLPPLGRLLALAAVVLVLALPALGWALASL